VVVSNGAYSQTNPVIQYGNWSVTFTGAPKPGDTFYVNPTRAPNAPASTFNGQQSEASSLSDNQNIALMAAVATNQSYFGNNLTLQQSYTSVVNDIGAKLSQAQTAQTTQQAVLTQAQSARDEVSGVNLDTELANLLKYQQAYQASSKIVSTAMQLFDYLIQEL
jgi:flagellar hook-associated protein 1 FlgK